jgi:HprK-related kinase A
LRAISLRTGPFIFSVRSDIPALFGSVRSLYGDERILDRPAFADFHVGVTSSQGVRRFLRPQAIFDVDGQTPIHPVPQHQHLPLLEWGMNWVIATEAHHYLMLHAAVIERGGQAVLMPAEPGSGKSTLTAVLVHRGWRLLSDEFALIRPSDGMVIPLARPISLKNESIDIVRRVLPDCTMSEPIHGTGKGTVALLRPPEESLVRAAEPATPRWIIFPGYVKGASARLEARPKAGSFLYIGDNSFNYSVYGARGFGLLADLVERCQCLEFTYSNLDEAVRVFDRLPQS